MSKPIGREQGFIGYLESLVTNKDRGAIANLRRGLGKSLGTVPQMDRYVLRFLPEDIRVGQDEPYYLLAALFAFWHQGRDDVTGFNGNLGQSLRVLVWEEAKKPGSRLEDVEKRYEKRLVALLNCHYDDLPQHLRQIVSLLSSKDVPVGWAQLLSDIKRWGWDDRPVQKAWARGFWISSQQREEKEAALAETSTSEADED